MSICLLLTSGDLREWWQANSLNKWETGFWSHHVKKLSQFLTDKKKEYPRKKTNMDFSPLFLGIFLFQDSKFTRSCKFFKLRANKKMGKQTNYNRACLWNHRAQMKKQNFFIFWVFEKNFGYIPKNVVMLKDGKIFFFTNKVFEKNICYDIWWVSLKFYTDLPKQHFPGVSRGLQKWSENQCDSKFRKILLGGFFIQKAVLKKKFFEKFLNAPFLAHFEVEKLATFFALQITPNFLPKIKFFCTNHQKSTNFVDFWWFVQKNLIALKTVRFKIFQKFFLSSLLDKEVPPPIPGKQPGIRRFHFRWEGGKRNFSKFCISWL